MSAWRRANEAVDNFLLTAGPVDMVAAVVGAVVVLFFVAVAVLALIAAAIPEPQHGSCKVGHYYTGPKAQRYFACDEWYPLPAVQNQP